MAHFYNVTAQRATAVTASETCCFLAPGIENLCVSKGSRIEIYSVEDSDIVNDDSEVISKSLKMVMDLQVYGRIVRMHSYKSHQTGSNIGGGSSSKDASKCNTHNLFILTEKYHFCVLYYDPVNKVIAKRTSGDLKSTIGRRVNYVKSCVDPNNRMIAMYLCDGHIKILPMPSSSSSSVAANGGFSDPYDLRLQDITRIVDISFLHCAPRPTLVVLHEDDLGARHLKTLTIDTRDKEFSNGPWQCNNQHESSHTIISVETGGVIVIGTTVVSYYGGSDRVSQTLSMEQMSISAYTLINDTNSSKTGQERGTIRYLLGNERGALYALALCRDTMQTIFAGTSIPSTVSSSSSSKASSHASHPITNITLDIVGYTTVASTLSFLQENILYAGSCYGDSQLVRLRDSPLIVTLPVGKTIPSYIDVLETYTNVGPILDMSVAKSERQGQDVLVTCSGSYGKGSLKVVRSGIGMEIQAQLDLPGIKGIWSLLSENGKDEFDKYIIQTFLGETRILSIDGDSMEECELSGFDANEETLYCANLGYYNIDGYDHCKGLSAVQVTGKQTRLLSGKDFQLSTSYAPVSGTSATLATSYDKYIAVAYAGGNITVLEAISSDNNSKLNVQGTKDMGNDVACMSMMPVYKTDYDAASASSDMIVDVNKNDVHAILLACGMWTENTVRILDVPSMTEVLSIKIELETQIRDVLLVRLGHHSKHMWYLMVGLGDGTLIIHTLSFDGGMPTVSDRRVITLGTKAITLREFVHNKHSCVFATGDRPTVIHWHNKKLMFTVVNLGETNDLARFHCEMFSGSLALTSPQGFSIGSIDDIQRLHVHTHIVDGDPYRITHHSSSNVYAVCSEKEITTEWGESSLGQVLFLVEGTFQQIHCYELDHLEQAMTCKTCTLDLFTSGIASSSTGGSSSSAAENGSKKVCSNNALQYVVVGTAYLTQGESDAGRLLVFSVISSDDGSEARVQLVAQYDTKGPVYTVCDVTGMIAAGINNSVKVYRLRSVGEITETSLSSGVGTGAMTAETTGTVALEYICGYSSNIVVLKLSSQDNFIINGDLMRSISLLSLEIKNNTDGTPAAEPGMESYELKEIARDQNTNYMRAIQPIGGDYDDHFMGADDSGNIFCVRRRLDAATEEDRARMQSQAEYHTGEYINVFCTGSLCSQPSETPTEPNHDDMDTVGMCGPSSVLYGAVSGCVGCIMTIDKETYSFFIALQKAILTCVPSTGGIPHEKWRAFSNDRRSSQQRNIVDGDVVETLLDKNYDREVLEDIAQYVNHELNKPASGAASSANSTASALSLSTTAHSEKLFSYTVDEIIQKTEEMARMH